MSGHTNSVKPIANTGWDARIRVYGNDDLVQTFIVVTERYVVVVDTMINAATGGKLREFAAEWVENGRSLLIINTHADYDHAWGNQVFNAPIVATRQCAKILRSADAQTNLAKMQADEPDIFGGVFLTPPTILFDETLSIDGGDLTLELFATPGHTADHLAIYIPEINTLLAADAAEVPFPFARTDAALPAMRQSLTKLVSYNAQTVLYCHAPVTIGPQLLHDNIAYFDKLEEKCRDALARGLPSQPNEDADLAALIDLTFDEATPHNEHWQDIHDYYRTQGHAHQIRAMFSWLNSSNQ